MTKIKSFAFTLLCSSLIIVLSIVTPYTSASENKSSYTLDEIVQGLLASQAGFSTLEYEYEMANEKAGKDIRKVNQGKIARVDLEGFYFHDDMSYSENTKTKGITKDNGYIVAFDGKNTFKLERQEKQTRAVIAPGKLDFAQKDSLQNPANYLWEYIRPFSELLADANNQFQIVGEESINGINTVKITGVFKNKVPMSLWFSPQYNFLPLKVRAVLDPDRNKISEYYLSELFKLPNGMFFPQTITFIVPDSGTWQTIKFKKISIAPIPEDIFRPKAPIGTHVTDHLLKVSYTVGDAADAGLAEINNLPNNTNSGDSNTNGVKQNTELTQKKLEEYIDSATVKIEDQNQAKDDPTKQSITTNSKTDEQSSNKLFLWAVGIILLFMVIVLGKFAFTVKKGVKNGKN